MRKLFYLFAAVFLFILSQTAFAGQDLRSVLEKELDRSVKLPNQKNVVFFTGVPQYGILKDIGGGHFVLSDYVEMDVTPFVYNDRVYVPVRPLLNAAGIPDENISFTGNEARAEAYPGTEYSISLTISLDRPRLLVNGRERPTYGPPVVKDGRTCLPVREIGEALAYAVYWQDPTDDAPGTV
ncbi:MAG: copper amine oxidase N-terminal domain-containing protein, partial [Desulfotomaculales bacterium]